MNILEELINREIEKEERKAEDIINEKANSGYSWEYYNFCSDKFRKSNKKNGYSYEIEKIRNDPQTKEYFIKFILDKKEKRIKDLVSFLHDNEGRVNNDLKEFEENESEIKRLENKNKIITGRYKGFLQELLKLKRYNEYPLLKEIEKFQEGIEETYIKLMKNDLNNTILAPIVIIMNELWQIKKSYIVTKKYVDEIEDKYSTELNLLQEKYSKIKKTLYDNI